MEQSQINFFAIYGAILSTIAILWNIRRDMQDRAEIKVSAKVVNRFVAISGVDYICVELSNVGKRPITIKEISYKIDKQIYAAKLSLQTDLPKELGEGQLHTVDIMKDNIENVNKIEFILAKDAREKTYWSRKYPLRGE
jgi:hypothetical protein